MRTHVAHGTSVFFGSIHPEIEKTGEKVAEGLYPESTTLRGGGGWGGGVDRTGIRNRNLSSPAP